jgi:prepilin-type N-terminal cleavage/methylation domain-containing protein
MYPGSLTRNPPPGVPSSDSGFTLLEFLLATGILAIISAGVFGMLADIQRTAGYQDEVAAVLDDTRVALLTAENLIRQAGNDPAGIGLTGIAVLGPSSTRIQSDLTGSAGRSDPDKGDPDGDIDDAGEDVTIGYDAAARTLELASKGGGAQAVASRISEFSMQYYDAAGAPTNAGGNVRKIRVTVSGTGTVPDPRTGRFFGVQLVSEVELAALP